MPRIRSIKHTFFTDERMAEFPRDVRLTFVGLITHADDDGRLKGDPRLLKGQIWPLDDDITAEVVADHLRQLADGAGARIDWYTVDGRRYVQIRNFRKHQYIQKPTTSLLPPPSGTAVEVPAPAVSATGRLPDGYSLDGRGWEGNGNGIGTGKEKSLKHPRKQRAVVSTEPERCTWLTPARDAWERRNGVGSFPFGRAAKVLAPIVEHGIPPDDMARRLGVYLDVKIHSEGGKFMTVEDFALKHEQYAGPLVVDGELTPLGRRATEPVPS